MAKIAVEDEKLKSYNTLLRLYEKASPIVRYIANIGSLRRGELPFRPHILLESAITLRMILNTLNKLPEPKDRELVKIKWEFQKALYNCIKAAESTEKYLEHGSETQRNELILNNIINSTVLAHEYIESTSHRLDRLYPVMNTLMILHESKFVPVTSDNRKSESMNLSAPERVQHKVSIVDSVANVIEFGLDKLGDLIIFMIERPFILANRIIKHFQRINNKN